jgi:hypothetical protein
VKSGGATTSAITGVRVGGGFNDFMKLFPPPNPLLPRSLVNQCEPPNSGGIGLM